MSKNPFGHKYTPKKDIDNSYLDEFKSGDFQVAFILGKWKGTYVDMESRFNDKLNTRLGERIDRSANFTKRRRGYYLDTPPTFSTSKRKHKNGISTIIGGSVFGNYCLVKQVGSKSKAIAFLALVNSRVEKLYSSLRVKVGTKEPLFKQYLKTGDESVLIELLNKYPKQQA